MKIKNFKLKTYFPIALKYHIIIQLLIKDRGQIIEKIVKKLIEQR